MLIYDWREEPGSRKCCPAGGHLIWLPVLEQTELWPELEVHGVVEAPTPAAADALPELTERSLILPGFGDGIES